MSGEIFNDIEAVTSDLKVPLGTPREYNGKKYRYCQLHASSVSAGAENSAMYTYASITPWVLNTTATLARANAFAGVCTVTVPKGYYFWLLVEANKVAINTNTSTSGAGTIAVDTTVYGCSTDAAITSLAVAAVSTVSAYLGYMPLGRTLASEVSSTSPYYVYVRLKEN